VKSKVVKAGQIIDTFHQESLDLHTMLTPADRKQTGQLTTDAKLDVEPSVQQPAIYPHPRGRNEPMHGQR